MIGHLPLWLVLAIWWMQRRNGNQVGKINYQRMNWLLNDLYYSLPAPVGGLSAWITQRAIEWIDHERAALAALEDIGVQAVGTVKSGSWRSK